MERPGAAGPSGHTVLADAAIDPSGEVLYEEIDALTIYPVTAYDVEE